MSNKKRDSAIESIIEGTEYYPSEYLRMKDAIERSYDSRDPDIAKLVDCLEEYASMTSYSHCGSERCEDNGKIARQALEEFRGGECE